MNMNSAPRPSRNEQVGGMEAVDREKLAVDFADLAERDEFAQIELLANQMKGRLSDEQIADTLDSAKRVLSNRNFHTSPAGSVPIGPGVVTDLFKLDRLHTLEERLGKIGDGFRGSGSNTIN